MQLISVILKKLEEKLPCFDWYISSCYILLVRRDVSRRSDKKSDIGFHIQIQKPLIHKIKFSLYVLHDSSFGKLIYHSLSV